MTVEIDRHIFGGEGETDVCNRILDIKMPKNGKKGPNRAFLRVLLGFRSGETP